jgi:hypothetical protein
MFKRRYDESRFPLVCHLAPPFFHPVPYRGHGCVLLAVHTPDVHGRRGMHGGRQSGGKTGASDVVQENSAWC